MIIGVDPDVKGAFTIMERDKIYTLNFFCKEIDKKVFIDYDTNKNKLESIIKDVFLYKGNPMDIKVYLEKPFAPAFHAGVENLWRNFQTVYLLFRDYNITIIQPRVWQKKLGIIPPSDTTDRRKYIKETAVKLVKDKFPHIEINNISEKTGKVLTTVNQGLVDSICITMAYV